MILCLGNIIYRCHKMLISGVLHIINDCQLVHFFLSRFCLFNFFRRLLVQSQALTGSHQTHIRAETEVDVDHSSDVEDDNENLEICVVDEDDEMETRKIRESLRGN